MAPAATPANVQGTATTRMSIKDTPKPASILSKATVAAEMGLAVMACCEAMTAMANGRSGRILVSAATVPATKVKRYVTSGLSSVMRCG